MRYSKSSVRLAVIFTSILIGLSDVSASPTGLMALRGDQDQDARGSAADTKTKPEAKDQVPALMAALTDRDPEVRRSAAETLGSIGQEAYAAVPALMAALKDQESNVR